MSTVDSVVGVVAGLLGVFTGASLARRAADHQRRITSTFDLHRELHGPDMMRARHAAGEIIEQHPDLDYHELRALLGPSGVADLHHVVYFFQRLWIAIECGAVREEHVPRLFGDTFSWWYKRTFRSTLVPTPTEMARDIEALWHWLETRSTEEQRQRWRGDNLQAWKRPDGPGP
ncbi:hypothetical protein [Streptomyces broussonetiae]|uniref:DUF4760 domain-containing protein n=1 Tax=Streptomyces broussonetiae TaxID=2686304 RepID=A0ABV5EDR5_9ACTN